MNIEEFKAKKEELETSAKGLLAKVVEEFLQSNKDALGVFWQQYTPSFNDGDPCEFSMGEIYVALPLSEEYDSDISEEKMIGDIGVGMYSAYDIKTMESGKYLSMYRPFDALCDCLNEFEDYSQSIFGGDVEVLIERGGKVTTEEYDCGY